MQLRLTSGAQAHANALLLTPTSKNALQQV